eukprot:TRINITY_DN58267_c0_g1_i1.p1 TRINITY_DN58267_c0_g1~~TRINITY_DN58267_c0_g1_i1.p1  ORF type:complete len:303 (-),score=37.38 TRINITY_DN58267_c0_g1_i1:30-938(-)
MTRSSSQGSPRRGYRHEKLETTCGRPSAQAIITLDLEGRVIDWSPEAEELTEFRRKSVMGMDFVKQLLTEDTQDLVTAWIHDAIDGKPQGNHFFVFYTLAGHPLSFYLSIEPRRGEDEDPSGVTLYCSVVGGHGCTKSMPAAMVSTAADLDSYCSDGNDDSEYEDLKSKAMGADEDPSDVCEYNSFRTSVPEAEGAHIKICLDLQGRVVEWGGDMERISQLPSNYVLGKHFVDKFLCIDGKAKLSAYIEGALSGRSGECCSVPFYTLAAQELTISFSVAPRFDEAGAVTGVALSSEAYRRSL